MALQFLVVRTVEARVRKANPKTARPQDRWTVDYYEESEASILVTIMCRIHQLLAPAHYRATCEALLVTDVVSDSVEHQENPEVEWLLEKMRSLFPNMANEPRRLHACHGFQRQVLLNTKEMWTQDDGYGSEWDDPETDGDYHTYWPE